MVEIFVKDMFSKYKINTEKAKSRISEEEREKLRNSLTQLQAQVDSLLNEKNTKKTMSEEEVNDPVSPLREMLMNRRKGDDKKKET